MSLKEMDAQKLMQLKLNTETSRWIKQLHEGNYEEAFELINLTAEAGDNIGIGEIPTLEYFTAIMQKSVAFGLYDNNMIMLDLIIIKPYYVARHVTPTIAQILLATREHPIAVEHVRQLTLIGCELASRQNYGSFTCCVMEVFYLCLQHLQVLREEGFTVTCTIPLAGLLAGRGGYSMSYVMYKELNENSDKVRYADGLPIVLANGVQNTSTSTDFQPVLRTFPTFTPLRFTITTGLNIRIRQLRLDDLQNCYAAFSTAIDLGYGVNEIPSYEVFVRNRVNNFYNFVAENENDGDIIAYFNAGPSRSTRCQTKNILGTSNLVILPKYRSQKLGREFITVTMLFAALCGYEHIVGTMAITNLPVIKSSQYQGGNIVGVLPRSIYFTNTGWTDLLIVYGHLKLKGLFSEALNSLLSRSKL